ncbi:MAG: hypothetical protein HKO95_02825 [Rhodobacteraceae bacterium]|jgi:uncharacterized membrane protein YraQ (UPF0718 family)|nr:permease [Alphaproteobacteria bacterium]MBT8476340.1 permease [Alphaproteobacteria bacterium]NNF72306.1 hypothetical protein [Paracoccaceae bacterium]NNK65651.1 hypothetical protein [Paracoccaceae bacterium]
MGFFVLLALLVVLLGIALRRGEDFGPVVKRFIEQFAMLVPRMLCALVAAGFIAQLLPKEAIARLLGDEAGIMAIPLAAAVGLLVPAGPVITFAIAAVFAKSGASTAALVTFVTSWSIFAAHRIIIYELPLLGPSFLRLRVVSAAIVPFLAGLMAFLVGLITVYGTATPT